MSNIELIQKLRETMGAGMMDCKKALDESAGDYDVACEILRKKGIASAQKKASRDASDGLVIFKKNNNAFTVLQLNCETDFVAKTDKFQQLLDNVASTALENKISDIQKLLECQSNGTTIRDSILSSIGSIGENMEVSSLFTKEIQQGEIVVPYIHNKIEGRDDAGNIIVAIIATGDEKSEKLLKQIAMHIAATNPISVSIENVDESVVNKEKEIYIEQAKNSGKNESIAEKMAEGRLRKFFEESVLLEQVFVIDGKTKISDVISNFEKENNTKLKIKEFVRIQVGVK